MEFIFFGRLEKEKGFDKLIEIIHLYQKNENQKKYFFHIFGEGNQKKLFKKIKFNDQSNLNYKQLNFETKQEFNVTYYGKRNYNIVIKPLLKKQIDYTLITSEFLETFGFVALESISNGVPILNYSQPALNIFNLDQQFLPKNTNKILNFFKKLQKPNKVQKTKLINFSQNFSTKKWVQIVQKNLKTNLANKKILIVSDFSQLIGGTEKHIQQITKTLEQNNQVELFFGTSSIPSLKTLIKSINNNQLAKELENKIEEFKPDIIWCHSILRFLGPKCIKIINQSNAIKIITIHDLGLFTYKPSELNTQNKTTTQNRSIGFKLKKKILINPILKELSKFEQIFIPSDFIFKYIPKELQSKTSIIPHFIEHD